MQTYSCRCGHSQWFGSMAPPPCSFCPKCVTQRGTLHE